MAKPNPLTQGLEKRSVVQPLQPVLSEAITSPKLSKRPGRVLVGAHFAPEVQRALKIIAAEESTTIQALLGEGINLIFARRQRPEIANIQPS